MAGSTYVQQTISPVDGSVVAERDLATPAQIDAVLDRAVAAQRSWRQVPLRERAEVVGRLVTPRGVPMPGSRRPLGSVSDGGGDRAGGGPAWWGARRPDPGGTPRRPPARPATAAVGDGR